MSRLRKGAAVLLAVMLVMSMAGGPVGSAAAASGSCSGFDSITYALYGFTLNVGFLDGCGSSTSETLQKMQNQSANLTHANIYEAASSQKEQRQSMLSTMGNYLQDSRTVAWSKGEAAAVAALRNGSTESEAQQAFNESVNDYLAGKQLQLIASNNVSLEEVQYHSEVAYNSSMPNNTVYLKFHSTYDSATYYQGLKDSSGAESATSTRDINFITETVTLVNGSTEKSMQVEIYTSSDAGYDYAGVTSTAETLNYDKGSFHHLGVKAPSSSYSNLNYYDWDEYGDKWASIQSIASTVRQNGAKYVSTLADAHAANNVNLTDYVSASTLAQEYAMDYNGTGHYSYAWAMLADSGLTTASLNGTDRMYIRDESSGFSYEGMMFSQATPSSTNGTWMVDTTYNASKIDGIQMVITTESKKVELTDNFTISRVVNESGGNVSQVHAQQYVYRTNNVSQYQDLQTQLSQLQMEIQEWEPMSGPTGDDGSSSSSPIGATGVAGILAVIGLLGFAASRGEDS